MECKLLLLAQPFIHSATIMLYILGNLLMYLVLSLAVPQCFQNLIKYKVQIFWLILVIAKWIKLLNLEKFIKVNYNTMQQLSWHQDNEDCNITAFTWIRNFEFWNSLFPDFYMNQWREKWRLNFRKKYMWLLTTTGEEILFNYHVVFVLYMCTGKLKLIISCLMWREGKVKHNLHLTSKAWWIKKDPVQIDHLLISLIWQPRFGLHKICEIEGN